MSYQLRSARYLAHEALAAHLKAGDRCVDCTMGNGHDTLFLASLVGEEGRVYAFDIQEQALAVTRDRLAGEGLEGRVSLILSGHEHLDEYVREKVHAVMFNLGWLPGGDKEITTRWETTREAVLKGLSLLLPMGVMTVCVYPGHPEGDHERERLTELLSALDPRDFNVLHCRFANAGSGAPECWILQKQPDRQHAGPENG